LPEWSRIGEGKIGVDWESWPILRDGSQRVRDFVPGRIVLGKRYY
jgi:hypothetical protein